jgi:uncharacterized protein YndB with AHSA1/START domain
MPTGKTKDAGWQIGVSRTVPHPVAEVWALLSDPEGVRLWLGAGVTLSGAPGQRYRTDDGARGEVRSYHPLDRIRVTCRPPGWDHETTVQVALQGRGPKTTVRFHQERLADAAERERQRAHWRRVADEVVEALAAGGASRPGERSGG